MRKPVSQSMLISLAIALIALPYYGQSRQNLPSWCDVITLAPQSLNYPNSQRCVSAFTSPLLLRGGASKPSKKKSKPRNSSSSKTTKRARKPSSRTGSLASTANADTSNDKKGKSKIIRTVSGKRSLSNVGKGKDKVNELKEKYDKVRLLDFSLSVWCVFSDHDSIFLEFS